MILSSDLVSEFAKITKDKKEVKNESTTYGTAVEYNGSMWVRLDGAYEGRLTPISTTADIKSGERVIVTIKDHTATVTGNISSPAARTDDVKIIANSTLSKGDVIKQVNSELKVEGNSIALTTGHFTINSKNFTLDASGNATFSGTITGAAGEFTKSFYVNVPHPISTYDNDDSAWRISCDDTSMFLGLYIPNELLEDPPFDNSMANIEISPGSMSIHGNSLFLYSGVGSIEMDYVGDSFTINSNSGTKIELSSRINVTGNMTCGGTINASTLQQGGKNISSLFAAASHSHSYLPLSGGTLTGNLTTANLYIGGNNHLRLNTAHGYDATIGAYWSDGAYHNLISKDGNSNTVLFGPASIGISNVVTGLRGQTVRIYSHTKGAVYLGSSGSTAITSDENLKNLYDIDERYEKFFKLLEPKTYIYKHNGRRKHMGFGARQVEESLLSAGLTTEEFAGILRDVDVTISADEAGMDEDQHYSELYSLRYEEFISLNTYMIQKLYKRVEELEAKLSNL